jgi:hypothetical protein
MRTPYNLFINRVTIKRAIPSLDAGQGPTETFADFLINQPAKVYFSVGSEAPFEYGRSAPQSFGTAIMAPNLGIVTNMRLVFKGEEYNITAVRDTSERDVLTRVDFDRVQ